MLAVLAPLAVLGSDLPRAVAWPCAAAAAAYALWLARREARSTRRQLVLAASHRGVDQLDGEPLRSCRVSWRGPLAFMRAVRADGAVVRLVWWPDTLPPVLRRELRLAVAARAASRHDRPMAP